MSSGWSSCDFDVIFKNKLVFFNKDKVSKVNYFVYLFIISKMASRLSGKPQGYINDHKIRMKLSTSVQILTSLFF